MASGTLGPILSDILTFDVPSIGFPTGIACGGSSNLVLRRDGSYTYSGHFHDSGGLDYSVKNAWVVVDQAGRAYTFADEGKVEGTNHIFGAERDHDWATNGTNAEIANHWADLAGAASWRCTSEIDTDVVAMLKTLVDEIKQAGQVVAEVIAVVGPIVLLV